MGAVFRHAPIEPRAIAVQVGKIHFVARCRYCRDGRRATTNMRPVDAIGRRMGDLNVCAGHAAFLVERARKKKLEVSLWDWRNGDRPSHKRLGDNTIVYRIQDHPDR